MRRMPARRVKIGRDGNHHATIGGPTALPVDVDRPGGVSVRLSVMMFLQYAVWGIWLPYLANYLQAPLDKGGLGFTARRLGGSSDWPGRSAR